MSVPGAVTRPSLTAARFIVVVRRVACTCRMPYTIRKFCRLPIGLR